MADQKSEPNKLCIINVAYVTAEYISTVCSTYIIPRIAGVLVILTT